MSALTVEKVDGQARLAALHTGHGTVETPVFMPVGTQGAVKAVLQRDLSEMGARMLLANAYHLYLRPGDALIKEMGGIQRFTGWDGAVLTDSGGYQIFSLGVLRKIEEEGVTFQSHIDGSKHFLTPERIVEVQENLGADVCMCLDECVAYPSSHAYASASVGPYDAVGAEVPGREKDAVAALRYRPGRHVRRLEAALLGGPSGDRLRRICPRGLQRGRAEGRHVGDGR